MVCSKKKIKFAAACVCVCLMKTMIEMCATFSFITDEM